MRQPDIGTLLTSRRLNAALAWAMVLVLGLVVLASLVSGNRLWALFAAGVFGVAVLPPLATRSARSMLPWEVLLFASLPVVGRVVATVPVTGRLATYLAVAALALLVAVELQLFTTVRMTSGFALGFVIVTTVAAAGVWAELRWLADLFLGTTLLIDPTVSEAVVERRLMREFLASTLAGAVAGLLFEFYVRRRSSPAIRSGGEGAE
jgi:hypothetical protein